MKTPLLIAKIHTDNPKFEFETGYNVCSLDVLNDDGSLAYWGLGAWLKKNCNIDYNWKDYVDIRKKFPDTPYDTTEPFDTGQEDAYKYYDPVEIAVWSIKNKHTELGDGTKLSRIAQETTTIGSKEVALLSTRHFVSQIESMREFAKLMRKNPTAKIYLKTLSWTLTPDDENWDLSDSRTI